MRLSSSPLALRPNRKLLSLVLLATLACHSWSDTSGHCHQAFVPDPATTKVGEMPPFLVGCHWAAMSGNNAARELVTDACSPLQNGQPLLVDGFVRLFGVVCHSWSGPLEHFHQTMVTDPAVTLSGVRSPFLVGCHSSAIPGKSEIKEFSPETFFPAQYGQPTPPLVRLYNTASHSCSASLGHCHQNFFPDPATTRSGVRAPFFFGCHCAAMSGKSEARELVAETRSPLQNGHPEPLLVRLSTVACHSWSRPLMHCHQTFTFPSAVTFSALNSAFFVGCHSAASSGWVRDNGSFICPAF